MQIITLACSVRNAHNLPFLHCILVYTDPETVVYFCFVFYTLYGSLFLNLEALRSKHLLVQSLLEETCEQKLCEQKLTEASIYNTELNC